MTPELLQRIGRALYGHFWLPNLAEALDVSERTMRRLMAGQAPIPEGLSRDLAMLVEGRCRELDALLLTF